MLPNHGKGSFRAMRNIRTRWGSAVLVTAVVAAGFTACDDPFAAFLLDVPETPSEATLFDFVTGRLQDPPAFDLVASSPVRVDQTREWDFLFRVTGGVPELAPFGAATDSVTDAGLRRVERSFESILVAPDQGYDLTEAQAVAVGDVFIARSRVNPRQLISCSQYAKLEILEVDLAARTVTFRYLVNPNCGDTVLEPGKHGSF